MADECVIDTVVLQSANASLTKQPRERRYIRRRLRLLARIRNGSLVALISSRLLDEYWDKVRQPRNQFVRQFFELVTSPSPAPTRCILNWKKRWSGGEREQAYRKCRFPKEDEHVLRTAIRNHIKTTIFTEEHRMLKADECIYRHFRVHICEPP